MGLRIGNDELGVREPLAPRPVDGDRRQRLGDVDTDDSPGGGGGSMSQCTTPAAHVEHHVISPDRRSLEHRCCDRFELPVIPIGVVDVMNRLRSVPRVPLCLVGSHRDSSPFLSGSGPYPRSSDPAASGKCSFGLLWCG